MSNVERESKPGRDIAYCLDASYAKGTNTTLKSRRQLVMEQHTIAYSKSHRENHIDARGKVNGEANTLSTGDGCCNQSTDNYVFTKVDKMSDIKFVGGVNPKKTWNKDDKRNLSRNYSQGERIHSPEGLSPCLSASMGGTANGSQLIVEEVDVNREQEERILKLASVDNQTRKQHIKDGTVPEVEIDVEEGQCIATRHLGRNGTLTSELSSTIQVAETPHVTYKEDEMKIIAERRTDEGIRTFKNDVCGTLRTKDAGGDKVVIDTEPEIKIRKLTPLECERLMGWPDYWTKYGVDEKGKEYELSNSARYKACGNGIVSNIPKALLDLVTGDEQGLRIFSTFAGVDGSGLYLAEPKYKKVGFAEYEPKMKAQHAANVLRYHYPTVPNLGDITKINVEDVPDHDIIFISAPCQSFSSAGANLGVEDTRGTLFYETARIMKEKLPKYFIFENVKNLLSKKHERTFEIMCEVYSSLGYELDFELINAKHYNVAQNRERVFMVGRLKNA